jgi:hypothetical protein
MHTSLKESETPGNLVDSIVVTPSGLGGNDAANVVITKEHIAQEVFNVNMAADRIWQDTIAVDHILCEAFQGTSSPAFYRSLL